MSRRIERHPDPATLMAFAAGTLTEPLAAVVAAHAALCPECSSALRDSELLGGALLTSGPWPLAQPVSTVDGRLASVRSVKSTGVGLVHRPNSGRGAADGTSSAAPWSGVPTGDPLPAPIARTYGLTFDEIPWRRLAPGIRHHRLPLSPGVEGDLRLLEIAPGRAMPEHGHGGSELTLVLSGSFTDVTGVYGSGDVQDVDDSVEHVPLSDAQVGCVCLIASERPARFKGLVERLLQPWTGF